MTTLNETLAKVNARIEILNRQISTIDQELIAYKKLPSSRKASQKPRVFALLYRKKTYEKQRTMLENQSMNLWTIANTLENVNTQKLTFDALQTAQNQIKQHSKDINIDKAEDIIDGIHDHMDNQNELEGLFSQPIGQDINDIDLEAELANLAEEEFNVETSNFHAPNVPTHSIPNRQSEFDQYGQPKIAMRD